MSSTEESGFKNPMAHLDSSSASPAQMSISASLPWPPSDDDTVHGFTDGKLLGQSEQAPIGRLEQEVTQLTAELDDVKQRLASEQANRQRIEQSLDREKGLTEATLKSIGDAAIMTDACGQVQFLNASAERLTGWLLVDALILPIEEVMVTLAEASRVPVISPVRRVLQQNVVVKSEDPLLLRALNGSELTIEYSAAPIHDREGHLLGCVITFRDISQSRDLNRQLTYHARHDTLTGLTNRREFERSVEGAIASARAQRHHHVLFYIDLDQFKIINDTCGHGAGDELLRQLAKFLRQQLRATDMLARLGGDEFGLLLLNCPLARAQQIAHAMREQIAAYRFTWQEQIFSVRASIGIVAIDETTQELADVLSAADAACYAAKEKGRNRIQLYQAGDRDLEQQRSERQWVARIEKALAENRFALHVQAIAPIQSANAPGKQDHAEILVRMVDETGGIVSPMEFIPAAERYGLMPNLDRWVIRTFLRQHSRVCELDRSERSWSCDCVFTINLSGATVGDECFWLFLEAQLAESAIDPRRLCFEITETAAIANLRDVTEFICRLKALGCRFALDDFGSGMSSFNYLKTLPVDYLKIDGSFIQGMMKSKIDRVMVKSFIDISHAIGLETIAEFVENREVLNALLDLGIDFVQGFGIARPEALDFQKRPALSTESEAFRRDTVPEDPNGG